MPRESTDLAGDPVVPTAESLGPDKLGCQSHQKEKLQDD